MKAAFKFVTTVTGLILIGLSVMGLLLLGPFSGVIAAGVARDLTAIHGASVTLADCKIRPFQQRAELQGLTIHNPDPFRTGPALVVERVDIDLDTPAFLSGAPGVRRILFHGVTAHMRHEAGEGTNLGRLLANARAHDEGSPDGMGFRVESLQAEDAILRVSSDLIPALEAPLSIGAFELDGLDERGAIGRGEILALFMERLLIEATGLPGMADSLARVLRGESARQPDAP